MRLERVGVFAIPTQTLSATVRLREHSVRGRDTPQRAVRQRTLNLSQNGTNLLNLNQQSGHHSIQLRQTPQQQFIIHPRTLTHPPSTSQEQHHNKKRIKPSTTTETVKDT